MIVLIIYYLQNIFTFIKNESGTKAVFIKFENFSQFNQDALIANRKFGLKLKDEMENDATIRDLVNIFFIVFQINSKMHFR